VAKTHTNGNAAIVSITIFVLNGNRFGFAFWNHFKVIFFLLFRNPVLETRIRIRMPVIISLKAIFN